LLPFFSGGGIPETWGSVWPVEGSIEVLVDTDTSRENIFRLAQQLGWVVEWKKRGDDYQLVLKKS